MITRLRVYLTLYLIAATAVVVVFSSHFWGPGHPIHVILPVSVFGAGLLLAFITARHAANDQERQRRQREHCCLECGYNLRASLERCPECGTPVPSETPPQVARSTAHPVMVFVSMAIVAGIVAVGVMSHLAASQSGH